MAEMKIKIAKHIIEVTEYEQLNTAPQSLGSNSDYGESEAYEDHYEQTVKRRRETVRDLAVVNFDNSSKFVTLTFRDTEDFDIRSPSDCNREFKKFIQRMRRRYDDFKYLAVIEFQDRNNRGAVHYHMLCNLPYIKAKELENLWGLGFIKINAIDKVDNIGAYVTKYMTKDKADDRLKQEKGYFCSKGLERPTVYKSWNIQTYKDFKEVKAWVDDLKTVKKAVYFAEYTTEHNGKISYQQFNLIRQERKEQNVRNV